MATNIKTSSNNHALYASNSATSAAQNAASASYNSASAAYSTADASYTSSHHHYEAMLEKTRREVEYETARNKERMEALATMFPRGHAVIEHLDIMIDIARGDQLNPLYEKALKDFDDAKLAMSRAANKLAQAVKLTDSELVSERAQREFNRTKQVYSKSYYSPQQSMNYANHMNSLGSVGTSGPPGTYAVTSTSNSASSTRISNVTSTMSGGVTGPMGPQGMQGPQGVKGDKGDTGPAGTDGLGFLDSVRRWFKG